MSVFSKVRNFLNRHKNKFIVSGVLIGSAVLASRYAQYKLREWQERETKEFLDRTRKQQHFESTERTCNQTILSITSTLNDSLAQLLNTEELVQQLRNNPTNRIELWDRLKILVFTRLCTLMYTNVLLVIVLRVQLNLIGGYLFKDTKSITTNLQENYLSMCHHLLETGVQEISTIINEKVQEIMAVIDLKRTLSLYDVEQIVWTVQVKLCENQVDPIKKLRSYVIQDISEENDLYNNMLRETADLLESEEIQSLATTSTNRGFSLFIDKLSEYYTPNGATTSAISTYSDEFLHPSKVKIPLAKLIPILNGLLTKNSFPETLVQQLILDDKIKTLAANVYEVFSHS